MAGMPPAPWRTGVEASFRGATFKVEVGGQAGGRRNVVQEFPKRDVPFTEDMGRRARRWPITGYIVCGPGQPDYRPARDALIAALETYGPGTLIHPTLGSKQVNPEPYQLTETRERGGIVVFEMGFVEAGSIDGDEAATPDTQGEAVDKATALGAASGAMFRRALQDSLAATGGTVSS